jgi:hypothetical protein
VADQEGQQLCAVFGDAVISVKEVANWHIERLGELLQCFEARKGKAAFEGRNRVHRTVNAFRKALLGQALGLSDVSEPISDAFLERHGLKVHRRRHDAHRANTDFSRHFRSIIRVRCERWGEGAMDLVLGLVWLFGTLYALISLFRPFPPFRSRKQAAWGLGGFQALVVLGAAIITGAAPRATFEASSSVSSPTPASADKANPADPPWLVRIKPGEKLEMPVAAPKDVAAFREKARAGLKTLDAAEVVIVSAVKGGRGDLARDAQNAAQEVGRGMTADRQAFAGTVEGDKAYPCERAAWGLSRFARSVEDGQGTVAVKERLRLLSEYQTDRRKCEAWLR